MKTKIVKYNPVINARYGFGFIKTAGSAYRQAGIYVLLPTYFWIGVSGIVKAFVWPALLIIKAFR